MEMFASMTHLVGNQERHHSSSRLGHSEDGGFGRRLNNSSFSSAQMCQSVEMEVVHTPAYLSSSLRAFSWGETLLPLQELELRECPGAGPPVPG
jgi:hypothetical protein